MNSSAKAVRSPEHCAPFDSIRPLYLEASALIERLHRRLLEIVKDEFERLGDMGINAGYALLLFNIGNKEISASELCARGYYVGSNASYIVNKLVEIGLLDYRRSDVDRRLVRLRLTERGHEVADIVARLYEKHVRLIEEAGLLSTNEFTALNKVLPRLERFWTDQILYRL